MDMSDSISTINFYKNPPVQNIVSFTVLKNGDALFQMYGKEVIRINEQGNVFINGNLKEEDIALYQMFRFWIEESVKVLNQSRKNNSCPQPNANDGMGPVYLD